MRKTLGALSVVAALASAPLAADPQTAATLGQQFARVQYALPATDRQSVSELEPGSPQLGLAVGGAVANMTRTLVGRGEERAVLTVLPPLLGALPVFATEITAAAIDNVPATMRAAVRDAARGNPPALGLGGIGLPTPPGNPGGGPRAPTSPN